MNVRRKPGLYSRDIQPTRQPYLGNRVTNWFRLKLPVLTVDKSATAL